MITKLTHVSLVVEDYDEAIEWYTNKLGLELRGDNTYGEGYRFVTMGVEGQDVEIVLHKPHGDPASGASSSTPGVVHSFVFAPDDCRKEVEELRWRGVKITGEPEDVPWGVQAIFEDLYGNSHVLVEQREFVPPQG